MSLSQQANTKHSWYSAYSAKQVLDNESIVAKSQKLPMFELMTRAGNAAFQVLCQRWPTANSVLVLSGKGNNGGDGFVLARLAHLANMNVSVLITCEPEYIKGDALTAYQAMLDAGVKQVSTQNLVAAVSNFSGDIIVDALFGIGFYGVLNEPMQQLVATINAKNAMVLSIDIPSGLCATAGFVHGDNAVIADVTVTFIVYKQGLLTGQAANFVGELLLADIDLGIAFTEAVTSAVEYLVSNPLCNEIKPLKKRVNTSHKGMIGEVLAIGGGQGMPGAIRLASEATLRCGAGLVGVCCHKNNQVMVFNGRPELMLAPATAKLLVNSMAMKKAKVILLGPGLGQTAWAKTLFDLIIADIINSKVIDNKEKRLVIDADALTFLAQTKSYCEHWVLTPHPKEAARLLGCDVASIEADRFSAVQSIVKQYGGICILKGAGTLISDGNQIMINSTGNAGMASGGMGDVLAGVVAAFTLQANDYFMAACSAVYIHGAAGDIIANKYGQCGMLASDLFTPLRTLVNAT